MHLLIIGPDWQITARFRTDLVKDLVAAGWRVTIAAAGSPDDGLAALKALGADCIVLPSERNSLNLWGDIRLVAGVVSACRRARPDAVLAFAVKPVTLGLLGARLARVPVRAGMITGIGYALVPGAGLRRGVLRTIVETLYRAALGGAQRLFFQNDDDIAEFRRRALLRASTPITRINGSGVNLDRFVVTPPPPAPPLQFVMVSRLLREKGVVEFAEAARLVKGRYPETACVLVGPTDTSPDALPMELVQGWVSGGLIRYVGPKEDVRPYLGEANVFVLPSYREGTPRSALEALACGRPVLTTDVPGCREVVVDGVTGRLVEARSAEALADGMRWFIAHADALPTMAQAARRAAEERFDVHAVNRSIMDAMVQDVAARRAKR